MPSKKPMVRLGSTEVQIASLVRDPRGLEDIISDDLEADFQEARYKNFNQKLFPFADAADLAEWDNYLATRYTPLYLNFDAVCPDCPLGPCNLKMAVGRCGLDGSCYQARLSLRKTCRGCLSQMADTRQTLEHAIKIVGYDAAVTWGRHHDRSDASHIGLMTALWPRTVRDLARAMSYAEAQMAKLLLSSYTGYDSVALEGMALHAGSLLMVSMDVSELLKTNFFGFNNASDHELTEMANWPPPNVLGGLGSLQPGKPVLTFLGDAFLSSWYAVKLLKEADIAGQVEVGGIGSVAHDVVRFYSDARVLGPMTAASKIVGLGVSDVIVCSAACINWDYLPDAIKAGTKVIWTGTESAMGLPDRTDDPVESIVFDMTGPAPGAWVRDVEKAAQIAVKLVTMLKRKSLSFMSDEDVKIETGRCNPGCDICSNVCPNGLLVGQAMRKASTQGIEALKDIEDGCYSCGHCQRACPAKLRLNDMILSALAARAPDDKLKMRAGRGPVSRIETTSWAFGSLMGNCPGIFHIFGCGDAKNRDELGYIAYELTWRNGIVFTAGCAAGDIGRHFNKNKGKYLFEEFGAEGQPRNIMNCGACSGCAHVIDQALKWPRSGSGISHYGNFAETADTCHNLIAPTAIVWGALTDRMYAIVSAWVRGGISVIVGPDSAFSWKRAMVHSKWRWEDSFGYSVMDGHKMYVDPTPSSMILPVETKEEAVTYAMALSMRAADIRDTRQIRLETYMELFSKFFGDFPDDWPLYVRSDWELPLRYKSRMLRILRESFGWDIDRLKVKRAKHPDGRLLGMGDFGREYGSMAFPTTKLPRLVSR
ncbi:MAG: hypothetical protein Q7T05_08270, partial [Dehalococcoidia bacterium]|nr:hypothetical protein [Dehalococcoidia bacterium]